MLNAWKRHCTLCANVAKDAIVRQKHSGGRHWFCIDRPKLQRANRQTDRQRRSRDTATITWRRRTSETSPRRAAASRSPPLPLAWWHKSLEWRHTVEQWRHSTTREDGEIGHHGAEEEITPSGTLCALFCNCNSLPCYSCSKTTTILL